MTYIRLTKENIASEHICCAFSDKKCKPGYELKKSWLSTEFDNGYEFLRLDERAKVFIEYGPAETAWAPVTAPNYILLGCFWVSGQYKGKGHGKALLQEVVKTARQQGKEGVAAVVGNRKFHFMSDTRWLMKQGFKVYDTTASGFSLISMDFTESGSRPRFNDCARRPVLSDKTGCVVYYSNRCPYSEYHVKESLVESCKKRGLPLTAIKLKTREQAQSAPTPAAIFSFFLNGAFITTDISVCMDNRFDKITGKR